MRFDHRCTITRRSATEGGYDEWGQPIEDSDEVTIYDGACQVYADEVAMKRLVSGDASLIGRSPVRLQRRPQVAPKQGDGITAAFNGVTRRGEIEAIADLFDYPRLQVRWL